MSLSPVSSNPSPSLRKTLRECQGNVCQCLADKINQIVNNRKPPDGFKGLKQRMEEQVAPGAQGPGTTSWDTHENEILKNQENLKSHLEEYDGQGCGGGTPIASDARSLATAPTPTQAEWEANNKRAYTGLTGSATGDVAVAAGGVTAAYLLYRGVRMLPSLAPPLWWTIPGNLAIP